MRCINKKLPYILIFLFAITIGIEMVGLIILQTNPSQAITFKPQVGLGIGQFAKCDPNTMTKAKYEQCGVNISGSTIGNYINEIYKYAISVVAIFATVMMMWGGLMWITAAGNASRVDNAKSYVTSAITGLVLALASYMVLYTINPDLTRFTSINPTKGGKSISCCRPNGPYPPTADKSGDTLVWSCSGGIQDKCQEKQICSKGQQNGQYQCMESRPCCTCNKLGFKSCKDDDPNMTGEKCKKFCGYPIFSYLLKYNGYQCNSNDLCEAL